MEVLEGKIEDFLFVGDNEYGSGIASGCGEFIGTGHGGGLDSTQDISVFNDCGVFSDGYGDNIGRGFGYGRCAGLEEEDGKYLSYRSLSGIEKYNGQKVYEVDYLATLIDQVCGNFAKGRLLDPDMTTSNCYIAKHGKYFAHGKTLREAYTMVMEKALPFEPIEERIANFKKKFPDFNTKVDASVLFDWHHALTGSCLFGREAFCREHGIDLKNGKYSVNEFIEITKDAYGGDVIKQLNDRPT